MFPYVGDIGADSHVPIRLPVRTCVCTRVAGVCGFVRMAVAGEDQRIWMDGSLGP